MIEEIGQVCVVEQRKPGQQKHIVWVETQIKSTCGSCEAQSNCGTGAIAKVFARKREKLRFEINETVSVGQQVKLGIPEENLLKASALVYFLPLCVLVISALTAQALLPLVGLNNESWIVLCSFFCTFIAFKGISNYTNAAEHPDYYPQILSFIPTQDQLIKIKQV
jgi:sigma-E factor negative regulatory protein RseC